MTGCNAYIIAARRSALGRIGGLHRTRRIEDLAAPVLVQALADAGLDPARVDRLAVGNTSAGSNPARSIGLVAGLPDRAVALTIDRHTASGLEAILSGIDAVRRREAGVVVAGGAEAFSTAPWRIAKPRTLQQMPRFVSLVRSDDGEAGERPEIEAAEALAGAHGILRTHQDELSLQSHIKAALARGAGRLVREIVAMRNRPEEGRDELSSEPDMDDLESIAPILGEGTLTAGNTSLPADGAAFVVVVSEEVHGALGRPPALVLEAAASLGVGPGAEIEAPLAAARALAERTRRGGLAEMGAVVELGETSAVQAITFRSALGLADAMLNPDGGQIARGEPGGAASAVLAVRLFSRLVRAEAAVAGHHLGVAVTGAAGGQGLAALFARA